MDVQALTQEQKHDLYLEVLLGQMDPLTKKQLVVGTLKHLSGVSEWNRLSRIQNFFDQAAAVLTREVAEELLRADPGFVKGVREIILAAARNVLSRKEQIVKALAESISESLKDSLSAGSRGNSD